MIVFEHLRIDSVTARRVRRVITTTEVYYPYKQRWQKRLIVTDL